MIRIKLTSILEKMKLLKFEYREQGWHLNFAQFAEQILLVGVNASGKSKTIKALAKVGALVSQRTEFSTYDNLYTLLVFRIENGLLQYKFSVADGLVESEKLVYISDASVEKVIIDRDRTRSKLLDEIINPPSNKLVVNVRRDTQLYPEMEHLQIWAENIFGFSFNETDMYGDSRNESWFYGYKKRLNDIVLDMEKHKDIKEEFYSNLRSIDYNITKIKALDLGSDKKVYVEEAGLKYPLFDVNMSKGMFRAIYVIAYLLYFKRNKLGQPAMLLVDDLCEGLDYNRSTKLGKLCYTLCEELGIQLMASSNDSFLMDVVDLKYWNILHREGSKVEVINASNNADLFDCFESTGLTNFDLFSSDFIARYKQKQDKK